MTPLKTICDIRKELDQVPFSEKKESVIRDLIMNQIQDHQKKLEAKLADQEFLKVLMADTDNYLGLNNGDHSVSFVYGYAQAILQQSPGNKFHEHCIGAYHIKVKNSIWSFLQAQFPSFVMVDGEEIPVIVTREP